MARITVEDCLDNVGNRFDLVMLATKRARQLATGGKSPLVKEDSDKATVIALREIAEGLVSEDSLAARIIEDDIADVFEENIEQAVAASADDKVAEGHAAEPQSNTDESPVEDA